MLKNKVQVYGHNKSEPTKLKGFILYAKRPNDKGEVFNTVVGYREPRQNETITYALRKAYDLFKRKALEPVLAVA